VTDILREAEEIDRLEDELYGEARGDELPEQLRRAEGREQALREAKRRLAEGKARAAEQEQDKGESESVEVDLDPERFVTRSRGAAQLVARSAARARTTARAPAAAGSA
jgi:hypothetical protein